MADYYKYVSFTLPLSDAEQQDWAIAELTRCDDGDDCGLTPGVLVEKNLVPTSFDMVMTAEGLQSVRTTVSEGLWITHDESANVDVLALRLQNIMRHFAIAGKWGFAWSNDCSKPRIDAYGGGACVVSQTEIESFGLMQWLQDHGVDPGY